jgi:CHAD domain-containing protein
MAHTVERELKFRIPEGGDPATVRAAVESAGFTLEPTGTVLHEDRYLDTDDWTLYRAGIALRLRSEGRRLRLEAKSVGSVGATGRGSGHGAPRSTDGLTRLEWAQDAPPSDPPWGTLDSGPVAGLLHPLLGMRVLERLRVRAQIRNDREFFRWLQGERLLGSLTVDRVTAPPSAEYQEIELELANGADEALGQVRRAVEERLGVEQSLETKLVAALAAAGERLPERREHAFRLTHGDRLLDVAHKTFARHFGRLLWNEPGSRLGLDPEYVHDMRVASRRLRTALLVLSDGFPETERESFSSDLQWVGRSLGRVRDLDVALHHLDKLEAEAPDVERPALHVFRQGLAIRRAERRLRLIERLDSERYAAFVERARAFCEGGPPAAGAVVNGVTPAYVVAPGVVARWMDGMREAYEKAEGSLESEDLHALRIASKRARYAIEYFADLEGLGATRRAKRIAGLQDFLGDTRDAEALARRVKKYARTVPKKDKELVMSAGAAIGHLERASRIRRVDLRDAWEKAVGES